MEVQVFGVQKSQDTRSALRFFSERRIPVHFVDLCARPASKGELQRFAQRFGVSALIDRDSKRYAELGLGTVRYDDARWMAKLAQEPLVLRMPLVRWRSHVTIGPAEADRKAWLASAKAPGDSRKPAAG